MIVIFSTHAIRFLHVLEWYMCTTTTSVSAYAPLRPPWGHVYHCDVSAGICTTATSVRACAPMRRPCRHMHHCDVREGTCITATSVRSMHHWDVRKCMCSIATSVSANAMLLWFIMPAQWSEVAPTWQAVSYSGTRCVSLLCDLMCSGHACIFIYSEMGWFHQNLDGCNLTSCNLTLFEHLEYKLWI